jgi:predicted DNA-binding protein
MSTRYPRVLGLRVSDEELEKLDALSKQSFRPRGDLLRALIHSACALDNLGLAFNPQPLQDSSRKKAEGEDAAITPATC